MDPRHLLRIWSALQQVSEQVRSCQALPIHGQAPWPGAEMHIIPTIVGCLGGQMRLALGPKDFIDLETGDVVVIAPGCVHQHIASRHKHISFGQGFRKDYSDINLRGETTYHALVSQKPYLKLMQQILETRSAKQRRLLMQDYLQHLMGDQHFEPQHGAAAAGKMYEYMRKHCHKPISIDPIIAASGLSRSRAFAVYKECYGISPHLDMMQRRCYLAQAFLRSGSSVTEAAERSGFPSRRHMTRAFNDIFGVSPRTWQQQIRD